MKLTEEKVKTLLETLSAIISDDNMLTREQRENMILTVATIGALSERVRVAQLEEKNPKKKPRNIDPVFPNAGKSWEDSELDVIHSIIDELPDQKIDNHVVWLSEKLRRTPHAIALKIVSEGRLTKEWAADFKPIADEIRQNYQQLNSGSYQ